MAVDRVNDAEAARRAVLRARAEALARVPEARSDAGEIFCVAFDLGAQRYAIEAIHLQEALPVRSITPLARTPDFIVGIVNLRGRILAVTNLKRIFNLPEDDSPPPPPPSEAAADTAAPSTDFEGSSQESEAALALVEESVMRHSRGHHTIVVIAHEDREVAIEVDRVRGAISVPLHGMDRSKRSDAAGEFIYGVAADGLIVIDAQKLVTSPSIVVR